MWNKPTKKHSYGFTLLEILAAMFVLSIVITLVFTSFNSVFSTTDHITSSSDLFEMGKSCLDRIKTDLEALHVADYPRYHPPDIDDDPELYRLTGVNESMGGNTFARLRFTSLAHLPLRQDARQGIAEIVYYAQEDDSAGYYILRRSDNLYPYPEFKESAADPVMCENVVAFEIQYFDVEGREYQEWDSEDDDFEYSTPRALGLKLSLGDPEAPLVLTTLIAPPMYRFKPVKR